MSVHTASRLSHRCFVGNTAGFLTWRTVWRGQPGGDPHLQLWLLRQQPPDFTNHTPAGGERENVWQLFTQGRRVGLGEGQERRQWDSVCSVLGRWEEQHDRFRVIRGHLFHCSDSHSVKASQLRWQKKVSCFFFLIISKENICLKKGHVSGSVLISLKNLHRMLLKLKKRWAAAYVQHF